MPSKQQPTPRTRLWFKPDICGQAWDVVLSNEQECPDLEGAEGFSHGFTTTIVIDESASETRQDDTAFHEMVHAMFDASGLRQSVIEMLGLSMARWRQVEERIVRGLAPAIHSTLKRNFAFSLPPKPKVKGARPQKQIHICAAKRKAGA